MPLIFNEKVLSHAKVAVWKISEEESFFVKNTHLQLDKKELSLLKGGRRLEWLASRYVLSLLLDPDKKLKLQKDKFGKPQIRPKEFEISISHSNGHVAAIVSKNAVGIDIQKKVKKISRIALKFTNDSEKAFIKNPFYLSNLHLIWGAKECLFKAYGRKEVDFIKHLTIKPFLYRKDLTFEGHFQKNSSNLSFNFEHKRLKQFYLVYGEKT